MLLLLCLLLLLHKKIRSTVGLIFYLVVGRGNFLLKDEIKGGNLPIRLDSDLPHLNIIIVIILIDIIEASLILLLRELDNLLALTAILIEISGG